jgi:RNA polymerase sigma-70 factor (ECF subfamily)
MGSDIVFGIEFTTNLQVCDLPDFGGNYHRIMSELVFAEIFELYRVRVVAWCYRISRNHDTANDLAQEVFLKAYRNRDSFRGDSSVSTWLYAIARNHCLTALKRHPHDSLSLDLVNHATLRDETAVDPNRAAEQGEASRRLLRLMTRTLDPLEVRVMTLHYGHEVPLATITRQLSLSNPSGAKAYIVNARRKLQAVLSRPNWQRAA